MTCVYSANSQWNKTHDTLAVKYQHDTYICKHEDIFPSFAHTHSHTHTHTFTHTHTHTYTHLHAGNCRGGEKQAYLLQGGKEWRRKVKKEKKKEKTRSYTTRQKEKVETESKEWIFSERDAWLCVCANGHSKAKRDYLSCNVFFCFFLFLKGVSN